MDEKGTEQKQGSLGEVCIRGANVTRGYYNNPSANEANFTADGWFRTGDQGYGGERGEEEGRGERGGDWKNGQLILCRYLDPDGFLVLTGRLKELINRGGEKISFKLLFFSFSSIMRESEEVEVIYYVVLFLMFDFSKISPVEIDSVLLEYPKISEAICFAVPGITISSLLLYHFIYLSNI